MELGVDVQEIHLSPQNQKGDFFLGFYQIQIHTYCTACYFWV